LTQGYRNKIEFSFGVYKQQSEEYRERQKQQTVIARRNDEAKQIDKEWIASQASNDIPLSKYIIDNQRGCGFHKQGEFSKIVDVESCGLISQKANQIFETIKKLCFESGLPVYDQKTHQGFFRHLVLREGVNTGQLMVNLSICLANLDKVQTKAREALLETFKNDLDLKEQISTFVITYNEGLADTVKNEKSETKTFRGDGFIHEKLLFDEGEVTFRISPFSFFQTNTLGAQKLFGTAFKMLGNVEGNILDLYCGAGSIGLSLLRLNEQQGKAQELIGIEIVEDAIVDARDNAKINRLEEQSFFVASPAEKALEKFPELAEKIKNLGVVVIDPPRDGLHKNVIDRIANLKKKSDFKLLYISCNPVTMARDVEFFLEKGFNMKEVQPVDMFPMTQHCECIGVFS
jgi:23S rRNA (uracil-5-)-methyltransferase RumA